MRNRIHHVTVEVLPCLLEEAKSFYSLVGFFPVEAPAEIVQRSVWLERDGCQIHLLSSERLSVTNESTHFALVVDDFDAVFDSLKELGHEPERRTEYWGSPRAYVRDPAGNLVELMSSPPT